MTRLADETLAELKARWNEAQIWYRDTSQHEHHTDSSGKPYACNWWQCKRIAELEKALLAAESGEK